MGLYVQEKQRVMYTYLLGTQAMGSALIWLGRRDAREFSGGEESESEGGRGLGPVRTEEHAARRLAVECYVARVLRVTAWISARLDQSVHSYQCISLAPSGLEGHLSDP